jgi:hypothetical protein
MPSSKSRRTAAKVSPESLSLEIFLPSCRGAVLTCDPLTNVPLVLTVHALDDREAGVLQKKIRR